jgi:membrane protein YqaA with SNARE-associated domain
MSVLLLVIVLLTVSEGRAPFEIWEVSQIGVKVRYSIYTIFFIAVTVASVFLLIRYSREIAELENYGYLGAFLVGFIAGSSLPLPLSYLLIIFTLGGIPGLHPWLVGLAGGVGAGLGGTMVYLVGRGGRHLFPGTREYSLDEVASEGLMSRFIGWSKRRGSMVVFVMSATLNPVFGPMAIAMGAMRLRLIKFMAMCILGNILKAMVISYAGFLGLGTLLRWLRV